MRRTPWFSPVIRLRDVTFRCRNAALQDLEVDGLLMYPPWGTGRCSVDQRFLMTLPVM
jgi:predicted RNA methylase